MGVAMEGESDEARLLAASEHIFAAIQARDAARLAEELADDFVHTTVGAPDQDRAAFLKGIAEMPYRILEIWGEELRVRVLGQIAVVSGVQQVRVELPDGKVVRGAGAFVDLFGRDGERWRLRQAVSVELPEPAE
jgi:ketosteroid isomerase-like protein